MHIVQITSYILNEILSNFMVNKKVKDKNAARGKNDICSPTSTLGWPIRNKISIQWPIGKLNFFMANKESQVFFMANKEFTLNDPPPPICKWIFAIFPSK
jgi:hypothetical protein